MDMHVSEGANIATKVSIDLVDPSPDNPRKAAAGAAADDALEASLRSYGQLYPLLVRLVGDRYKTIDGNRRLETLRKIGATEVFIHPVTADNSMLELGAVANMIRANMHPLDECDVICRLVEAGEGPLEVGVRFGQTELWVNQRIALSRLEDGCARMFRDGQMGTAHAIALTRLTPKQQGEWRKSLKANPGNLNESYIKYLATTKKVDAKKALFDLSLYPADFIEKDLFSDEVLLTDVAKFEELQLAALAGVREGFLEQGWNEVVITRKAWHEDSPAFKGMVRMTGKVLKKHRAQCLLEILVDERGLEPAKWKQGDAWIKKSAAKKLLPTEAGEPEAADAEDVEEEGLHVLSAMQKQLLGWQAAWHIQDMCSDPLFAQWILVTALIGNSSIGTASGARLDWRSQTAQMTEYPANEVERREIPWEKWSKMTPSAREDLVMQAAIVCVNTPVIDDLKELPENTLDSLRLCKAFLQRYTSAQLIEYATALEVKLTGKPVPERPTQKAKLIDYVEVLIERTVKEKGRALQPFDFYA